MDNYIWYFFDLRSDPEPDLLFTKRICRSGSRLKGNGSETLMKMMNLLLASGQDGLDVVAAAGRPNVPRRLLDLPPGSS